MCGLQFSNDSTVHTEAFSEALQLIFHRGPDAGSVREIGHVKFGHRRLKIVDLDTRSDQPFTSADGRYVIVFNGEIYNFRELRQKHGIVANTTSDTEILVELYARVGVAMLDELYGMFAFVIYDKETGSTFAARDRLGVKPLYYHEGKYGITFASEIRQIKALCGLNEIDPIGLRQYLKCRAFFNGRTIYKNISMFPAGHYYLDGKVVRYWALPEADVYDKIVNDDEVKALIQSAIDYRCIADVPIGSYLSGGVDSTIVAGLSSQPHTWTIGFPDENEFEWGRIAAQKFGCNHHEVSITDHEFIGIAKMMIDHRGEPLSVPNEVMIYKMTKAVKEYNTVVLSGEGADELFFGYDRIFRWAMENAWDLREFDRHYSYGSHADDEILEDILSPVMGRKSCLDRVASFFQMQHLHGLLRRLDNSTMMCSVEAREPFVDHRLVELMYGVSPEYRMDHGIVKAPLKRIYGDLIPREIIERPKVGFPVPTDRIFAGKGRGMDKWLHFNLETLCGAPWDDIQSVAAAV